MIRYLLAAIFAFAATEAQAVCLQYVPGVPPPLGWAAPWDVHNTAQSLITVPCAGSTLDLTVGRGGDDQLVWNRAFMRHGGTWQPIVLSGPSAGGSWLRGMGAGNVSVPVGVTSGAPLELSAWVCALRSGVWKCGCRDTACTSSEWVLQRWVAEEAPSAPRAFPSARGYGAQATGGRGGIVRFVTTLADSGAGSLREAVSGALAKTVIFRVAGYIDLTTNLVIGSNTTIAGQTAPGGGVCTRNATPAVKNATNVIIRHFCSRPGNAPSGTGTGLDNRDAMQVEHSTLVIIDRSSFSWSTDELLTMYFDDTDEVTIQWSLLGEALWQAGNSKGTHPMGPLSGPGTGRVTWHHNMFSQNGFRNPQITNGVTADVVNNFIFGWGQESTKITATHGYSEGSFVNVFRNVYKPDTLSTVANAILVTEGDGSSLNHTVYVAENIRETGAPIIMNREAAYLGVVATAPVPDGIVDLTPDSTVGLMDAILARAGRTVPARDGADLRMVADAQAGTDRRPNSPDLAGGYPVLAAGTPCPDPDDDGMCSAFETSMGFDPNVADNNGDHDGDGYRNLEEYINQLAGD